MRGAPVCPAENDRAVAVRCRAGVAASGPWGWWTGRSFCLRALVRFGRGDGVDRGGATGVCPVVALVLIVSWPMMRVSAIDYGAREPPAPPPWPLELDLDLELQAKIRVGSQRTTTRTGEYGAWSTASAWDVAQRKISLAPFRQSTIAHHTSIRLRFRDQMIESARLVDEAL